MNEQEVRDLNRQYEHTIVDVQDNKGLRQVVHVGAIFYHGGVPSIVCANTDKVLPLEHYQILDSPKSRAFDFDGKAFVYKHRPERQWRKGICRENSLIYSPVISILQEYESNEFRLNLAETYSVETLANLFKPVKRTLQEALDLLTESKFVSVCVDSRYHVSVYTEANTFVLWRMGVPLCKLYPQTRQAELFEAMNNQEVSDFFNRQGAYYAIK